VRDTLSVRELLRRNTSATVRRVLQSAQQLPKCENAHTPDAVGCLKLCTAERSPDPVPAGPVPAEWPPASRRPCGSARSLRVGGAIGHHVIHDDDPALRPRRRECRLAMVLGLLAVEGKGHVAAVLIASAMTVAVASGMPLYAGRQHVVFQARADERGRIAASRTLAASPSLNRPALKK